ncbi:MAG: hypothetical protein R2748_33400 [Bryobacterales bacterium]
MATLASGLAACSAPAAKESPAPANTLAGRTLPELRGLYHADLFDDFLPFLDAHVIDHERGGFMCNTDRNGVNL